MNFLKERNVKQEYEATDKGESLWPGSLIGIEENPKLLTALQQELKPTTR
jgi:hypothetical protein